MESLNDKFTHCAWQRKRSKTATRETYRECMHGSKESSTNIIDISSAKKNCRQRMQQRLELVKEIKHLGYRAISERVSALIHESLHTLSTKTKVFTMHRSPHGTTALTATVAPAENRDLTTETLTKDKKQQRVEERFRKRRTTQKISRRPKLLHM